jgi:hypothetical protein
MRRAFHFFFALAAAATARAAGGTVWVTPHESYSSSVGVLGCKVDTNRIAYWPPSVDCDNICVSLTYGDRTVHLLRIDQSQGAHDVSYDAWNYLLTGYSAADRPATGGAVAMEYQDVDPSVCADLIHTQGNKLPLSAPNSMNFLASCLSRDTWVARNHLLYNILDPICEWGSDETCTLDWPTANQPACPSKLGSPTVLTGDPVYNIQYMTGNKVLASSGTVIATGGPPISLDLAQKSGGFTARGHVAMSMAASLVTFWLLRWI